MLASISEVRASEVHPVCPPEALAKEGRASRMRTEGSVEQGRAIGRTDNENSN